MGVSLLLLFLILAGCEEAQEPLPKSDRYLVGAHYYHWYPDNFTDGTLRKKLVPPQPPQAGWYQSADVSVVEQHIAWASRYGIDFFTLDYWPDRPEQNLRIDDTFLMAANLGDIKFAIMHETAAHNYIGHLEVTVFTEDVGDALYDDLVAVGEKYFDHPNYLTISGRPVIFFYLTRTFFGDFVRPIEAFREKMKEQGYDPIIIADEIYWQVIGKNEVNEIGDPFLVPDPQPDRIRLFDAITYYNLYKVEKPEHDGYGADTGYLDDVIALLDIYREAVGDSTAFVPGVMPGYNDRGVRLEKDHYAIPRQWTEGGAITGLFEETFDKIAIPQADSDLNMILITSWNEWNEDTAIEPAVVAVGTTKDNSASGKFFTQGYSYEGHGVSYLKVVRDKVVAIAGKITRSDGTAVNGLSICAWSGSNKKTCSTSNSEGYYRLTRLKLPPGEFFVGPEASGGSTKVEVVKESASTGVDIVVE